jgi:hypothetical protein
MICNLDIRRARGLGFAALAVVLTGPLAGCATPKTPKLAVCDGRHKRPANPYGSILPGAPPVVYVPGKKGVPVPVPAPPRAPGAPAAAPSVNPAATSALTPDASRRVFASC